MRKKRILILVVSFTLGLIIGCLIGRDYTVISLRGLPKGTAIHFEMEGGTR